MCEGDAHVRYGCRPWQEAGAPCAKVGRASVRGAAPNMGGGEGGLGSAILVADERLGERGAIERGGRRVCEGRASVRGAVARRRPYHGWAGGGERDEGALA